MRKWIDRRDGSKVQTPDDMGVRAFTELDQGLRAVRSQRNTDKLKIVAVVHDYMPALAAGSERMLQHLLRALADAGHDVSVNAMWQAHGVKYVYDGVRVYGGNVAPWLHDEPDILIWHHAYAAKIVNALAAYWQVPHVVVMHNSRFDIAELFSTQPDMVVWNTQWVREDLAQYGHQEDPVVRPPLMLEAHRTQRGECVTLSNLSDNKGVEQFAKLVYTMPDTPFLGVVGSHGTQVIYDEPNLRTQPIVQDMREVWSQTKVLLMLSEYESYGMIAAEACASGIPVIAASEPRGPREVLGAEGTYIARDDTDAWSREISRLLNDPNYYASRSHVSQKRGDYLAWRTGHEVSDFVQRVEKLAREESTCSHT